MERQAAEKVEYRLLRKERRIPGLTLFSYNTRTHEIKRAEIVVCRTVDFVTRLPLHQPRITVEPDCVYRQALNRRNFEKILRREHII